MEGNLMSRKMRLDTLAATMIINCIPPYAYEINKVLGLPNGFAWCCRFPRRMSSVENPEALMGRTVLVVLRDCKTAQFVPVRRMRLSNVLEVGHVCYVEYILGDIVDLDSQAKDRDEQLRGFNRTMNAAIREVDDFPGPCSGRFIFTSSDFAYGIKDSHFEGVERSRPINSWGNLTQVLGSLECYADFDFLRVFEIVDSKGEAVQVVRQPHRSAAGFHLKDNSAYTIRVFHRSFTHRHRESDNSMLATGQISLQGKPGEIQPIRTTQDIIGKYDLHNFSFKAEPVSRTRETSLSLEVRRDHTVRSNIDIPISISIGRVQKLMRIVSPTCFVVGIALLFAADQVWQSGSLQADLMEKIGILLAIISSYCVGRLARSLLERIWG